MLVRKEELATCEIREIINLRHHLHQYPEVSNQEKNTALTIKRFVEKYKPDEIIEGIGGYGLAFVYHGKQQGPVVAIRAELDALPIHEVNEDLAYKSEYDNTSHKCGHDGHMSMVAGIAPWLSQRKLERGKVILLFQPAEETGEGAARMLADPKMARLIPDHIFSIHNLPGYPKNQIVAREGVFNAASKGLVIKLTGKTAHAAEPHNGVSPMPVMVSVINMLNGLINELDLSDFGLVTIVHASLGEPAFGVSPGEATVMTTIRAYHNEDLKEIENAIRSFVKLEAKVQGLAWEIKEREAFRSSTNTTQSVNLIKDAANNLGFKVLQKPDPLNWSEDFGLFTEKYNGAMFGLGSGTDTPDLHNPDYDFPDDILETGIKMYKRIIEELLN